MQICIWYFYIFAVTDLAQAGKNTSDRNDKKEKKKKEYSPIALEKKQHEQKPDDEEPEQQQDNTPSIPQKGKQAQSLQQKINRNQRWRT